MVNNYADKNCANIQKTKIKLVKNAQPGKISKAIGMKSNASSRDRSPNISGSDAYKPPVQVSRPKISHMPSEVHSEPFEAIRSPKEVPYQQQKI